ncbi:coiled-coil domain-containing protein [Rossellomorea aquimaris]|uniref:hypothetical protein n=1 Tax=Rossellomorea aquimaris TaxID=189382 RepID=UPI0007D08F72|nr:hypothetical protein [Rossellomorea aquimaris]
MEENKSPLYHLDNQELIYMKSQLQTYEKRIHKLKRSSLFAENEYLRNELLQTSTELKQMVEHIQIQDSLEEDLIKDRNTFREKYEEAEGELKLATSKMYDHQKQINLVEQAKNEVAQELSNVKIEKKQVEKELRLLKKECNKLKKENKDLAETNDIFSEQDHKNQLTISALKAEVNTLQKNVKDLKNTLYQSEETKKEIFRDLLIKAEKLEGILVERKSLIERFNEAKKQLIQAEKMKKEFFLEIISSYKRQLEEQDAWLSGQFADIDRVANDHNHKLNTLTKEQKNASDEINEYVETTSSKFEHVEEKLSYFLNELSELHEHQNTLTDKLASIKEIVLSNDKIQTDSSSDKERLEETKLN